MSKNGVVLDMALATGTLLGVGNTAEVFALSDTQAAWIPYDWADFARLSRTATQLTLAGFDVALGTVWHEDTQRSCAIYPRAVHPELAGLSLAEAPPLDPQAAVEYVQTCVAAFERVGLSFVHYEPKHILHHNGGYLLTGLAHAVNAAAPPLPTVRNWGPYSCVGDSPLCFFASGALTQPAVTTLVSLHAAAACCSLIATGSCTDVVAAAAFSSTAAQIKLSLSDPDDDPASTDSALAKIVALPTHSRPPPHVVAAALNTLALKRTRCCACFNI